MKTNISVLLGLSFRKTNLNIQCSQHLSLTNTCHPLILHRI
jgi:hypothetical protein